VRPSIATACIAVLLLAISPALAFHARVSGPFASEPPPFGRVLEARPGQAPLMELSPGQLRHAEALGYDAMIEPAPGDSLPLGLGKGGKRTPSLGSEALAGARVAATPNDPTRPIRVMSVCYPPATTPGYSVGFPVTVHSYATSTLYIACGLYEETPTGTRQLAMNTGYLGAGQERTYNFSLSPPYSEVATCYIIGTFYSLWGTWVQSDAWRFPVNTAASPPTERVAILVNSSIYNPAQPLLDEYCQQVAARFSAQCTIHRVSATRRQDVRRLLQDLYSGQGITGAILVGLLPWPAWEFPWGDNCPAPYYYEDLDGVWGNVDGDAYLDHHRDGPHPGPEIWVAWMRPPQSDESRVLDFLQRCLDYYRGGDSHLQQGLVHISSDWGYQARVMGQAVGNIFGGSPVVVGGPDVKVSAATWLGGLGAGYSVCNVWAHSNALYHRFDLGTTPLTSYWYEVAAVAPGPLLTVNYGCHCADFATSPDGNFSLGYVQLNPGGLAQLGVTRKAAMGNQSVFFNALAAGRCVGRAYMDFIQFHYQPQWISYWFPGEDQQTFIWDYALNGNPFLEFP